MAKPRLDNNRVAGNGIGMDPPAKAKVIRLQGRGIDISLALGFGRAVPTQGGPVYGELPRPQRKALTVYEGQVLVKLDVPILLDSTNAYQDPNGLKARADVWPVVLRILNLTRPKALGEEPPDFTVKGPIPFSGLRCKMEWPEFVTEPAPWVLDDGRVIRQALVLKLCEFIDPDPLKISSGFVHGEPISTGVGGGNARVTLVQKQGETLVQLAARVLGDPGEAKAVGHLNGIRDVRKPLDKGAPISLPH